MYKHHHIGIQFFAEPEQQPKEGQETGGSGEQTGGNEPLTFDQWLDSNPAYRSEFDRRNTKAVQTARTKWEQEQAENQDEATKLANLTTFDGLMQAYKAGGKVLSGLTVDGIFGANTKATVVAWQNNYGLDTDGICELKTWAAILGG